MPVYIIAEIGVNYSGLDEDAPLSAQAHIRAAKEAGANFVKFQLFNKETIKDSPLKEKLEQYILTEADVKTLKEVADKEEMGFILTPMYLEAVEMAAKYTDIFMKIRYKDHTNVDLLNAAYQTGKDLLISVPRPQLFGCSPVNPYNPRVFQMFCIPKYPPEPEDFNLDTACVCKAFSSHFPHTVFDLAFAINRTYDDSFIEKHVKLTFPARNDPIIDDAVSITFEELKKFITQLRLIDHIKRTRL